MFIIFATTVAATAGLLGAAISGAAKNLIRKRATRPNAATPADR